MDNDNVNGEAQPGPMDLQLAPYLDEARENLARLNEKAVAFIRERPGTCIAGAVVLGFVVGKIAARY